MKTKETFGAALILLSAVFWGLFPIFTNHGAQEIPPLTFATLVMAVSAIFGSAYAAIKGTFSEVTRRQAYVPLIMVTLFIIVIPYILYFFGTSRSTALNSSILELGEIIFTLVFVHFIGEKTTGIKLLGAGGVFLGALFILWNNNHITFSLGEILILASTAFYPIGNFYSKRALNYISPPTIIFVRSVLGAICLFGLVVLFEDISSIPAVWNTHWKIISFTGIGIMMISKIFWYEGLRFVDISKAVFIVMTFPLFSILALVLFFNESFATHQWVGVIIMMIGIYFSFKRKSVPKEQTAYNV